MNKIHPTAVIEDGAVIGQPDFSAWTIGAVNIGNFINAIIAFLMKAAAVYYFIIVPFNRFAASRTAPALVFGAPAMGAIRRCPSAGRWARARRTPPA